MGIGLLSIGLLSIGIGLFSIGIGIGLYIESVWSRLLHNNYFQKIELNHKLLHLFGFS